MGNLSLNTLIRDKRATDVQILKGVYSIYPFYWRVLGVPPLKVNPVHRFKVRQSRKRYMFTHDEVYVECTDEIIAVLALLNNGYVITEYLGKCKP